MLPKYKTPEKLPRPENVFKKSKLSLNLHLYFPRKKLSNVFRVKKLSPGPSRKRSSHNQPIKRTFLSNKTKKMSKPKEKRF